jgi:hypothetical protein
MRRMPAGLSKKVRRSGAEGIAEPGLGIGPLLPGLINRHAQGGGYLLMTEAGEVSEFDHPGGGRVLAGQPSQGIVEGE